jgi:chemotaxis protein histidine kinase CheA
MEKGENFDIFIEDSKKHLEQLKADLTLLSTSTEISTVTLQNMFKAVQAVKGGAGLFGFTKISSLVHGVERVLNFVDKEYCSILISSVEKLAEMISDPDQLTETDISQNLAELNKVLLSLVPASEKESISEFIEIKDDGACVCTVSKFDFSNSVERPKGGEHFYLLKYDLFTDIIVRNKTPQSIVNSLTELCD